MLIQCKYLPADIMTPTTARTSDLTEEKNAAIAEDGRSSGIIDDIADASALGALRTSRLVCILCNIGSEHAGK